MRGDEGHCMGIVFIPLAMCVDQGTEEKMRRNGGQYWLEAGSEMMAARCLLEKLYISEIKSTA